MSGFTALGMGPIAAIAVPLALCVGTWVPTFRRVVRSLAPWSALPALALALHFQSASVYLPEVLLGTRLFRLDSLTQGFLLLTALVWTFAGWTSRAYLERDPGRDAYWGFYLATLGGNLGVVLAQDLASFYAFLMLMTFASLGLILHERSPAAHRAGVVYLVMSLLGEVLLLALVLMLGQRAGNAALHEVPSVVANHPQRDLIMTLIFAGFGVKAGLVPLHLWLPLAHPVAPTPASAVLSGAMIKAGLLGWLRFMPLGVPALSTPGAVVIVMGLVTAYYGAGIGVTQTQPKAVLAYSSLSQMGFMVVAVGIGLASSAAEGARTAILGFALHHALAKSALFLGVSVISEAGDVRIRRWVTCGLILSALEIAGAPLTSGAAAKAQLSALLAAPRGAPGLLGWAVSLAAVGSTLLMLRFLQRLRADTRYHRRRPRLGLWLPWALLLVTDVLLHLMPPLVEYPLRALLAPEKLWGASWPILLGATLAWGFLRAGLHIREVPPGDLLVGLLWAITYATRASRRVAARIAAGTARFTAAGRRTWLRTGRALLVPTLQAEERLRSFEVVGIALLCLLALLLFLSLPP